MPWNKFWLQLHEGTSVKTPPGDNRWFQRLASAKKCNKYTLRMQDLQESEDAATQFSTAVKLLFYCMYFYILHYFCHCPCSLLFTVAVTPICIFVLGINKHSIGSLRHRVFVQPHFTDNSNKSKGLIDGLPVHW